MTLAGRGGGRGGTGSDRLEGGGACGPPKFLTEKFGPPVKLSEKLCIKHIRPALAQIGVLFIYVFFHTHAKFTNTGRDVSSKPTVVKTIAGYEYL